MKRIYVVLLAAAATLALSGCADLPWPALVGGHLHAHSSSSLVDFLYPDGHVPPPTDEPPQLTIPLRVGLSFLPTANAQDSELDEAQKEQLLERIKQHFASRKFVTEIVVIPDYYLNGQRGYEALDGVQRLYGVDVMALVSFDQETHLDQNEWSLAYFTIVGAYVIKGSRHDVSTLVDLAVVDPRSRKLIIRAGGTDLQHGNTTLLEATRQTRQANITGFSHATDQMIEHFDLALTKFESDVRSGTASVRVVSKNGTRISGGGGAFGGVFLVLLLLTAVRRAATQR
jgi:rhombotail lipoprotein